MFFETQKSESTISSTFAIQQMKHRGFEPRTTWLKVKCSTDWANAPWKYFVFNAQSRNRTSDTRIFSPLLYQLSYLGLSCGNRIWTYDLRVMSPTSFQTAPSRDIFLSLHLFPWRMGRGGFEPPKHVAADLQSVPFGHSGIYPFLLYILFYIASHIPMRKPMIGLEPITCWLQVSCSANWATSAYYHMQKYYNIFS